MRSRGSPSPSGAAAHPSGKVFGVALSKLIKSGAENGIPLVCWEILKNLGSKDRIVTEGLFRVSAAQPEVTALLTRIENGEQMQWDQHSPHLIATLLKKWLIDLPEPVFPFAVYESMMTAMDDPIPLKKLTKIFKKLPSVNKALAEALLLFLSRVSTCEVNQMTPQNLAVVFAPILLQPPRHKDDLLLLYANKGIQCIKYMIDHVYDLYPQAAAPQRILSSSKTASPVPLADDFRSDSPVPLELFTPFAETSASASFPASSSSPVVELSPSVEPVPVVAEPEDDAAKCQLLRTTLDGAIRQLLENLDDLSQEIQVTSSVADAVMLSKKIRSAYNILFDDAITSSLATPSASTARMFGAPTNLPASSLSASTPHSSFSS
jgi:hypothetical protein